MCACSLPRHNCHKVAHRFLFGDGKCCSIRAFKPKSAGRPPIEIERPLDLKVGSQNGCENAGKIGEGYIGTKPQNRLVPRSGGGKCAAGRARRFQAPDRFANIDNEQSDKFVIRIEITAVDRGQKISATHCFFQIQPRFAWLIDYPKATRFRRKNRELERSAIASRGIFDHDVAMLESAQKRRLGLGRDLRPLRFGGGKKKKKKNRGAKLSHRTCRSKPGSADRFESDPKLDSTSGRQP